MDNRVNNTRNLRLKRIEFGLILTRIISGAISPSTMGLAVFVTGALLSLVFYIGDESRKSADADLGFLT